LGGSNFQKNVVLPPIVGGSKSSQILKVLPPETGGSWGGVLSPRISVTGESSPSQKKGVVYYILEEYLMEV